MAGKFMVMEVGRWDTKYDDFASAEERAKKVRTYRSAEEEVFVVQTVARIEKPFENMITTTL